MEENRSIGKIMAIIVVVIIIAAGTAFLLASGNDKDTPQAPSQTQTETDQDNSGTGNQNQDQNQQTAALTVDEVKRHNSEDDCWTIIRGNVYDLTSFIPRHPGGDEILRACGEDATTFFESRTDENGNAVGSGTPHSSSAQSQLETLKLGPLQN